MHNVEGVRLQKFVHSTLGAAGTVDIQAPELRKFNTTKGRSRVLRVIAARTWVNCPRVPLDLLSVHPPLPYRNVEGAPVP